MLRVHAMGVLSGIVWLVASPAVAQSRPTRTEPAVRPTLGTGFSALDAGRCEEAARIAVAVLHEAPGSHGGALLQVSALAYCADPVQALAAYDAWRARQRADDPFLLAMVGEGVARQLTRDAIDPELRLAAAELLLSHGVAGARALLTTVARAAGPAGAAALARAGDARAAQRAAATLPGLQGSAKAMAIDRLGGASDAAVIAAVTGLAADSDPMVRTAVAGALGQVSDAAVAVPALERLLADPSGQVQQAAAVALVRLGEPQGEPLVAKMLASGIGDLVLAAAEALPNDPARWADRVRPVLESEDPVERLRAARLLKDVAPADAAAVLRDSLASDNVVLRDEAARVAVDGMAAAAGDWRQMLNDSSGWLRLAGARALMDLAGAPL